MKDKFKWSIFIFNKINIIGIVKCKINIRFRGIKLILKFPHSVVLIVFPMCKGIIEVMFVITIIPKYRTFVFDLRSCFIYFYISCNLLRKK